MPFQKGHKGHRTKESYKNANKIFFKTLKHRKLKRKIAMEKGYGKWMLGKKRSPEIGRKISEANRGKIRKYRWKLSKQNRRNISLGHKGNKTNLWKGGITPLHLLIRTSAEFLEWRKQVFERDNYKCKNCNAKGYLHAHHKIPFSKIFREFLQKYSQFSPIEDKETLCRLAITYEPFWDIGNGQTLCKQCHSLISTRR